MIFGIPKELPPFKEINEYRVGFSPMGVKELTSQGAKVYVESQAGEAAGFKDEDYIKAGASVVYSKEEAYKRADVVIKVRCPQPEEFSYIKEGQVICAFMHLVTACKEFIQVVKDKKLTLIGYEIIQKDDGRLPIIIPMSEIAGKMAVQIAGRLLESQGGGRGVLLSGIPGIPPAEVAILGAGTLGKTAAKAFAGIGANVYIIDNNRDKLEYFHHLNSSRITTLFSSKYYIERLTEICDVLIGAVLIPGKRAPILVTKEMVAKMKKGSVIIDFSIDQGGCVETSQLSPDGKYIYSVDGVIHFCMPNATTLVARTATHALSTSMIPYFERILDLGIEKILKEDEEIKRGIYAENGIIKEEYLV